MSFAGTYEQQSQENFVDFMTAIGIPGDLVERGKDLKSVTEIVQDGNHFVITITTGPRVLRNEFTIGVETEMETLAMEKAMSTAQIVDGKLVVELKGVTSVVELKGDLLITVMTLKNLVYKNISKRV